MEAFFAVMPPFTFALACAVGLLAGLVKGIVGFAMPMVLISGLSFFLSPELALAGLILPTLVTNLLQSLRQGLAAAWNSVQAFWVFLLVGAIVLVTSAQLVRILSIQTLMLMIGLPVTAFALLQLVGWTWTLQRRTVRTEAAVGTVAGFLGGISGIWGPPTVLYLTALGTEKTEQMRVQGVIYGLGAVALVLAHTASGVLNSATLPFSVALVPPALLGMWIGGHILDRIDQAQFRKATLLVLLCCGLNLIRRAIFA